MSRLIIQITSKEQLGHIFRAEKELLEAGVTFDTGSMLKDGIPVTRYWDLDWSLAGAMIAESIQPLPDD